MLSNTSFLVESLIIIQKENTSFSSLSNAKVTGINVKEAPTVIAIHTTDIINTVILYLDSFFYPSYMNNSPMSNDKFLIF